jgi:nucleoside-diphosphate-sugar epimerase
MEGVGVKMRVLVTGHNGYIGSVMVKVLEAADMTS